MRFGEVAEIIASQVHPMNCCKENSVFHTENLLDQIQFIRPVMDSIPVAKETDGDYIAIGEYTVTAAKETDVDYIALGECTVTPTMAARETIPAKETVVRCEGHDAKEMDYQYSFTNWKRDIFHLFSGK